MVMLRLRRVVASRKLGAWQRYCASGDRQNKCNDSASCWTNHKIIRKTLKASFAIKVADYMGRFVKKSFSTTEKPLGSPNEFGGLNGRCKGDCLWRILVSRLPPCEEISRRAICPL